jgi:hypothetical protein
VIIEIFILISQVSLVATSVTTPVRGNTLILSGKKILIKEIVARHTHSRTPFSHAALSGATGSSRLA